MRSLLALTAFPLLAAFLLLAAPAQAAPPLPAPPQWEMTSPPQPAPGELAKVFFGLGLLFALIALLPEFDGNWNDEDQRKK